MDDVQRAFYVVCFQRDYHAKTATEFQQWFVRIASHAYGPDFESVRAGGPDGDFKADGRLVSASTIFQCYAPQGLNITKLNAKIEDDFAGAKECWPNMRIWTLVVNTNDGLPPSSLQRLDDLRRDNPSITIEIWMQANLSLLFDMLNSHQLEDIFGYAPSATGVNSLVLDDIVPLINELAQQDPVPGSEPLSAPSVEKLQRNSLSLSAMELLRVGRRKEHLVSRYLSSTVRIEIGERIAEAFRRRYAQLKGQGYSPDVIFGNLQQYAGASGEPTRQDAGLAVLSYFFERCDIFEDATDTDENIAS